MLKKERIPHLTQDAEITVYGDESERFANLFHKETRRPMLRGVLNAEEGTSLQLVREIVKLLTGEEKGHGQPAMLQRSRRPAGGR